MKSNLIKKFGVIAVLFVASGCASIVKGRLQDVSFQSTPEGASVIVDGRTIGKTPLTVNMQKKKGQVVVFEKAGYKPFTFSLETRTSRWLTLSR